MVGVVIGVVIGVVVGIVLAWLVLAASLLAAAPERATVAGIVRLLPDLLRLIRRLAADRGLPRGVRLRLALLLGYLALPIDLIPDFVPVIGYADDAIVVAAVLRAVIRHAGIDRVRAHWPGTDEGFAALTRLLGHPDRR